MYAVLAELMGGIVAEFRGSGSRDHRRMASDADCPDPRASDRRYRHRTGQRCAPGTVPELRRTPRRCYARGLDSARHQPSPGGVRRAVDRPPVHGHAAGGWASLLPRSRHGAPVGSCPHPPRRVDRAIRALRRARLARRRFRVPWPLGVQRLLRVGVELEGTGETPYTDAQYQQLASLTLALLEAYPSMSTDRIVGHAD